MPMERLLGFFQGDLVNDIGFTDDQIIDSAVVCEAELKRARLSLPPPPPDASEYPTRPFGLFVPPSVEEQIGRPILETASELLRGRRPALRRDSRLSISIPPDGGPAFVESFDIPAGPTAGSLGPRLPNVVSLEENDDAPGGSKDPDIFRREMTTTAHDRRAAFAKSRSIKQASNGVGEKASGFPTSLSTNGKSVSQVGRSTTSGRRKARGQEASDNAAPQAYGVSVRL